MVAVTMTRMMSTLNPNAPLFVPASYVATEDFSEEWWHLVKTSPAFRDYWLSERSEIMEDEFDASPLDDEFEDLLEVELQCEELENAAQKQGNGTVLNVEKEVLSALASLGVNDLKSQQRIWHEPLKYHEKILNRAPRSPKKGSSNLSRIQQPRA